MNTLSAYQASVGHSLETASVEELMVKLYEGMITKIMQAKERFDSGENVRFKECIVRAMRIADALSDNLNMEEGGETAKNLERLYSFVISELSETLRIDTPHQKLDDVIKILDILLNSWKEMAKRNSHA